MERVVGNFPPPFSPRHLLVVFSPKILSHNRTTFSSSYLHPNQSTTQDPHPPARLSTKGRNPPSSFDETGTTPSERKASLRDPTSPPTQEADTARFCTVESGDDVEEVIFGIPA
ncbi:hypothetical protein JAAARDRAFT_490166 [Jaapia argillacea MUCL 33604]|uniref:Uncharacterized protein n=1 Tax=Jaapia argillacea MUCL 33604 TaxID=933084 RepID=A0A067PBI0_9AGAM|nr:hypothetical protein JAAARDRAFT_490166 [Jaapia argillacea MUCL 33604]